MSAKINDVIRCKYMEMVKDVLINKDEEVLLVKSNTFSIPWVEGDEEGYINVTFSIPKGSRDGEGYDGYAEAENYDLMVKVKAKAKAEAEAKRKTKGLKTASSLPPQ